MTEDGYQEVSFRTLLHDSVEKIASFDRGWLREVRWALLVDENRVEKIASFDRGWLLGVGVAVAVVGTTWRK